MLASSGTGAMEASIANLFSPGDKVLVINGGKFGERWLNIANAYGLNPIEIKVPWGQAVKVADVEKQLKAHPDIQGVMIQASETSTTVLHPVKEIAAAHEKRPAVSGGRRHRGGRGADAARRMGHRCLGDRFPESAHAAAGSRIYRA